jgi:hypothetical protein
MENIEDMTVREAWHPYQRECGFKSQIKVETIEENFRKNLDAKVTFWIKTQLLKDEDPAEDDFPEYELNVTVDADVTEIKNTIRTQEGMESDEKFSLIFRGKVLKDGKKLLDYEELVDKEMQKWPRPYAGTLWVSYEHFEPPERSVKVTNKYFADDSAAKNLLQSYRDI